MRMQIGEGFAGGGPDAAHVNTVLGERDGPVGTAWATALATPSAGHAPFVVVVRPNLPVLPATLFVPKAAIAGETHARLTWGAAQAGIADGVVEAVATGLVDEATVERLVLIAAVWVDPSAGDEHAVHRNNRDAVIGALRAASDGLPTVADVLAARGEAWNPFFRSPT